MSVRRRPSRRDRGRGWRGPRWARGDDLARVLRRQFASDQDGVERRFGDLGDQSGFFRAGERAAVEANFCGNTISERTTDRPLVVLDQVQVARRDAYGAREVQLRAAKLLAALADSLPDRGPCHAVSSCNRFTFFHYLRKKFRHASEISLLLPH